MRNNSSEWTKLYNDLCTLLPSVGINDPLGNGDFWLVDDDWGGKQQKICFFNPEKLTLEFVHSLQKLLQSSYPNWSIVIVFETPDVAGPAMKVDSTIVEYYWDIAELRRLLHRPDYWLRT